MPTDDSDNLLIGTEAAETIHGLGDNDTLTGGAGFDQLVAGDGNDTLARWVAAMAVVAIYLFGAVALVSGIAGPAEARSKKQTTSNQKPSNQQTFGKGKGNNGQRHHGHRHHGPGRGIGIGGFGLGDGINIYIGR